MDIHGEPVPVGVAGELHIGGVGVARGYLVELGEIEVQLKEHPEVREAVVVARKSESGDQRLVAYYTYAVTEERKEPAPLADGLREYLAAKLPAYMVPAAYVWLDRMPLTPGGKLNYKALPEPDRVAYGSNGYDAPQGEIEELLARVWAEALNVKRISRQDNFFALGGHSLLVLRLVNLLDQMGITMLAADLFLHPTIVSLAEAIRLRTQAPPENSAICLRGTVAAPPLFLVHCGAGELLYTRSLIPYIDDHFPIYGLPASTNHDVSLGTVERMSSRLLSMIRSVQPNGPYGVAGYSFGGLLAYEVAAQLIDLGQAVDFLGLFDSRYKPGATVLPECPRDSVTENEQLLNLIDSEEGQDEAKQTAINEMRAKLQGMEFETLVRKCRDMALLPDYFADLPLTQLRSALSRIQAYRLAELRYSARRLPIPLHLFAAQNDADLDGCLGWNVGVADNLRVIPVAGTHRSIMSRPDVEPFGRALSRAIRKATQRQDIT